MEDNAPALVELEGVTKRYGPATGEGAIQALRGVSLALAAGEALAVVGPSGSGKSTLLNVTGALDRPTSGTVRFEGRDLAACSDRELAGLRNRAIGFVFQLHHLLPQCTVLENVLLPTLPCRREVAAETARANALRLLERVGLAARARAFPGELSGGERQRVAVVRALVNHPRLVLADEPTGALDAATAERVVDLLVELNREEGAALVVVTHAAHLARRIGRVMAMRDGFLGETP